MALGAVASVFWPPSCNLRPDRPVPLGQIAVSTFIPSPMRVYRVGLLALLLAVLSSPVLGQASRTVTRTVDLSRTGEVHLSAYKGRIDVRTVEAESARVEVRIEGDDPAAVDQTRIRFQSSADRLEIETDYDEVEDANRVFGLFSWGSIDRPATNYTLAIPRSAGLDVDTYSAATTVTALDGPLQFEAYSADLTADRVGGALTADTYSGTVRITRADGTLTMDTYSGDLHADALAGAVAFTSYSGSATLGFTALTADCQLESFSGAVDVSLPSGAGAVVETSASAFETDLPARTEPIGNDRVRATIGDGGPTLRFDTFGGTLMLRRP